MQIKHRGHKVFGAGVLIEATNQISHGGIKFLGMYNWRIQNQTPDCLPDRIGLVWCHTNQHFKINSRTHLAPTGQEVGKSNIKKVVPRNPNAHCLSPLCG